MGKKSKICTCNTVSSNIFSVTKNCFVCSYSSLQAAGKVSSVYFTALIAIGNVITLYVFLAILLMNFVDDLDTSAGIIPDLG